MIILFRKGREQAEFDIAKKHFTVAQSRTQCKDQLVIGRYACLPFYRELEKDLEYNGCHLINSHAQHDWIAGFWYYHDLKDFTPKSWEADAFWSAPEGQYIVKGKTNSRKHQWQSHMFAETKKQAIEIACELRQDPLIGEQGIIYRSFVKLKILGVDEINGMPHSNEWRLFYYRNTRLSHGYYWSTAQEETIKQAVMTEAGLTFADQVANIAQEYCDFYVLDIAETITGDWILIEINDGQQSGLSENDPDVLYSNLKKVLCS